MTIENTPAERITELAEKQRAFFASGATRNISFRRDMLDRFDKGLRKWEEALCDALWKDLHKSRQEAFMTEIGLVYGEIGDAWRNLRKWARTRRWDLVFLTGSPSLGRIAMQAQAKYLTPMVLELGGKSPCIVDRDADLKVAARRIAWGKCLNSGQTCIAPDYLFLHEDVRDSFIEAFKEALKELYPDGTKDSPFYVHMVRDSAFERVTGYFKDGEILCGGHSDPETRWIEPTLLGNVSPDAPVMQEEIFGPVFPVMTFRERKEVENFVNGREKPLAFYYFGKKAEGWDILGKTTSGGACINDTIMHIANPNAPFGGVGNSGMGSYHSERSFLAFSHERSVIASPTWTDPKFRYMPYGLFKLIRRMLMMGSK